MVAETSSSSREVRRCPLLDDRHAGTEPAVHLCEFQGDVTSTRRPPDALAPCRVREFRRWSGSRCRRARAGVGGATARPPTLRKIRSASRTRSSTLMVCGPSNGHGRGSTSPRQCPRSRTRPLRGHRPRSCPCAPSQRPYPTLDMPVPMPYSAPRRETRAAYALATRVLVGMHPELTHVPPTSLRSIDGDRVTRLGQPAGQRRSGLALRRR